MEKAVSNNRYRQLEKNTVKAKGQLTDSKSVRFYGAEQDGVRVMFVGNSITLHGVATEIGWDHEWGMAASDAEKDYVHILMRKVKEQDCHAAFCICQVAAWECNYQNGKEKYPLYKQARAFDADIIVMRFVENCPGKDFDNAVFKKEMSDLLDYLNPSGKAAIILTTSFWPHPGDQTIIDFANEKQFPVVTLGDLGEQDEMMAKGLFSHEGVAMHPGDLGMETIAKRIFKELEPYLQ